MSESENNNNGSGSQKVTDHRDFALTSYAGDVYTMNDYYGTPVLMCIWGSWCDACKAKLPIWQELYIESQNYGFEFITVVMPSHFNERDKQDFYDWWETEYVLISLLNDEDARFVQHFEIDRIPVYLVFGSDGTLLYVYHSIPSNEEIITQMQELIAAGY